MTDIHVKSAPPAWKARQFHVLPEHSHQHRFLVDLWEAVRRETGGRLDVSVHAQSDGRSGGSGADAFDMLLSGELEFYTLNGNAIGRHRAAGGNPGRALCVRDVGGRAPRERRRARRLHHRANAPRKGIHRFPRGLMENGFRQTFMFDRPIRHVRRPRGA